jgi:hypothetical protein
MEYEGWRCEWRCDGGMKEARRREGRITKGCKTRGWRMEDGGKREVAMVAGRRKE